MPSAQELSPFPSINAKRINDTLQHSCQWGATPDGGMNRVALNDDDATVRRWLIDQVKELGCEVKVDRMGNIFAIRPGRDNSLPPIGIGSHLDTQATGGRYDGILGVMTSLEILRACKDAGYVSNAPLALVNWTNEEGCRFVPYAIGSGVWAGKYTTDFGHGCKDVNGITQGSELERHGFDGPYECSHKAIPLSAQFEVHIEQGPILCSSETPSPVAAVTGVQGLRWYDIVLKGIGSHAGTTPMNMRKDAVICAAKLVLAVEEIANKYGGQGTNGRLGSNGTAQAHNCILGEVELGLDLRHKDEKQLDAMATEIEQRGREIAAQAGVQVVQWNEKLRSAAMRFHPDAVQAVREACDRTGHPRFDLVSGAGHDS